MERLKVVSKSGKYDCSGVIGTPINADCENMSRLSLKLCTDDERFELLPFPPPLRFLRPNLSYLRVT